MSIPDGTLGGYIDKHGRPPAFEGVDGVSYSVDLYVTEGLDLPDEIGGALLFVQWSDDGAQPVGHVETDFLVRGPDLSEVKTYLRDMALTDVKDCLDHALAGRKERPGW